MQNGRRVFTILTRARGSARLLYVLAAVLLTGIVAGPAVAAGTLEFSRSSLNFANVVVGSSSAIGVKVTNTGKESVVFSQESLHAKEFSVIGFSLPRTLDGGEALTFIVKFSPSEAGVAVGTIEFASNATNRVVNVALMGTGVALSATPNNASFDKVPMGTTDTRTIELKNLGKTTVIISSVNVSGAGFKTTGLKLPYSLTAGKTAALEVEFTPTEEAESSGKITVDANAGISATVVVSGTGVADTRSLATPTSLNFGNVTVGQPATLNVDLKNTGNSSVKISGVSVTGAEFSATGISEGLTIGPQRTAILAVKLTPKTVGRKSGSITISSNAANAKVAIALSGVGTQVTGTQAQLTSTPASVSFGSVVMGNTNSQTITLKNNGTASVTMSAASASGAGFSISGLATPTTIAAGASTTFNVAFAPTSTASVSGSVSLVNNGASSPLAISLSGTGQAATQLLGASSTSLSFGNVNDGSSSTLSVTLTNNGNSNVTISSVTPSGTGFSVSGVTAGTILTPNETATLNVLFAPTVAGSASGSVNVTSNATNSPALLSLSGTGVTQSGLDLANPVCGLTNDATAHIPNATTWAKFAPPAVGGTYGTTGDDAVFGCTVTRLTNAATDGIGQGEVQYYSTDSVMSADDTYVFIFDQNGNWHIVASGATIGNATYVGHAGQVVVNVANFPSQNTSEPVWDVKQDNTFWITRNNALYECVINGTNSTTCTLNHTFSEYSYYVSIPNMANMTPGGWISMAGQNVQGSSMDFFVYHPSTSTKSPVYTPPSCTADLATSVQPGCIHGMTPFIGEYTLVDNENLSDTVANVWVSSAGSAHGIPNSDHGDLGYDLNGNIVEAFEDYSASGAPGGNGPFGACTDSYRPTVVTYSSAGVASAWSCMFDLPTENGFHVSYEDGTVRPWVVYSMQGSNGNCSGCTWGYFNSTSGYTAPSSSNWEAYANEIDMVRIDANNDSSKIYRLALTHTRAYDPNGGYWADVRANVSKDGNYIIFTSNSPYGSSGCGSLPAPCTDVFMVSAPNQAPLFP